jgi:hypothetical protein
MTPHNRIIDRFITLAIDSLRIWYRLARGQHVFVNSLEKALDV